jgi:Asp-tRNA(Asn)/Glu-tRNA(Gln) amidotransferase A subunit family amidase
MHTEVTRELVITGKAKMNSFGNWAEPTEYIDYQAPWNPREDCYQSPRGRSSGRASAIAAYDWFDIAMSTDSKLIAFLRPTRSSIFYLHILIAAWGSVTRPALWCGSFALRPSLKGVLAKGVEP